MRILLINNGKGNEFRNYNHPCYFLGEEADLYVGAAGHFGNMSRKLVKDFSTDLGYEYLVASNKSEFKAVIDRFLTPEMTDKSMLLEVFTQTEDESKALEQILNIFSDPKLAFKNTIKQTAKNILGKNGYDTVRKIVHR